VLPRTGQTVAGLVGLGALLIGGGAALMASRRRTGMALTAETSHPNGFDAQP
jgi:LPXTG-motif cell wall-anchored protein